MSETTTSKYHDAAVEAGSEIFGDLTFITPYQLHKLVSKVAQKEIRPQMMYNYVSKGVGGLPKGQKAIPAALAIEFAARYAEKNGTW